MYSSAEGLLNQAKTLPVGQRCWEWGNMEWLAVVSTGNSLWAHRWIWKKPMKMIGQSGGQETWVVTQQKTLKTHGLSWKWWSLFFASKKAGFQQVKHINLSQFFFRWTNSLWRLRPVVQAQANVTHFASDEPFVELGDGPLESKWSQLLLPQGQLWQRCQDFWFMSWILPGSRWIVGSWMLGVFINWMHVAEGLHLASPPKNAHPCHAFHVRMHPQIWMQPFLRSEHKILEVAGWECALQMHWCSPCCHWPSCLCISPCCLNSWKGCRWPVHGVVTKTSNNHKGRHKSIGSKHPSAYLHPPSHHVLEVVGCKRPWRLERLQAFTWTLGLPVPNKEIQGNSSWSQRSSKESSHFLMRGKRTLHDTERSWKLEH